MTTSDSPVLIVGLGNPGAKYAGTRHNIGYLVLHELLDRPFPQPAKLSQHKRTGAFIAETRLAGRKVILARTATAMNVSGGVVKGLAGYFGLSPADIFVIHDEMEKDFGTITLRLGGGDKGHNGLKSISRSLGTKDYHRLSVGIGRPAGRMDPSAFVLGKFRTSEAQELPIVCADAADALEAELR